MEGGRMTEIIVRGQAGGKTTELIRRAAEAGAYIVCTDTRRAGQVMRLARELGLTIPMPLTVGEWQERAYYPPGTRGLMFDDLDRIVQLLSPVPVLAVTWTEDAEPATGDASAT
jgi:hypothetical protein